MFSGPENIIFAKVPSVSLLLMNGTHKMFTNQETLFFLIAYYPSVKLSENDENKYIVERMIAKTIEAIKDSELECPPCIRYLDTDSFGRRNALVENLRYDIARRILNRTDVSDVAPMDIINDMQHNIQKMFLLEFMKCCVDSDDEKQTKAWVIRCLEWVSASNPDFALLCDPMLTVINSITVQQFRYATNVARHNATIESINNNTENYKKLLENLEHTLTRIEQKQQLLRVGTLWWCNAMRMIMLIAWKFPEHEAHIRKMLSHRTPGTEILSKVNEMYDIALILVRISVRAHALSILVHIFSRLCEKDDVQCASNDVIPMYVSTAWESLRDNMTRDELQTVRVALGIFSTNNSTVFGTSFFAQI